MNRRTHIVASRFRAGFSLLEMIIVVAIIAMLAALVVPKLTGHLGKSKVQTTKAQIENLAGAVEQFYMAIDRYPTDAEGLQSLIERPTTLPESKREAWRFFLNKDFVPQDGWGGEFVYKENDGRFLIVSLGADGRLGGEGDDADLDNRTTR